MRIVKQRRGQFIIIAALFIAIMIVSVGTIMYRAGTYYKQERWEEYLSIIENVEMGSCRAVEISLASFPLTMDEETLKENMNQWQNDAKKAYEGFGVILNYSLVEDVCDIYGVEIDYNKGLALDWYKNEAFSAANATFNLNITSIGLRGYTFVAPAFLRMEILDTIWDDQEETLTVLLDVDKENLEGVYHLEEDNFSILVDNEPKVFTLAHYYIEPYDVIYKIECSLEGSPSLVSVSAHDQRGIKVIANSTITYMHVGDISMWYTPQEIGYRIYTEIPILFEGEAVSNATVYLETILPDNSVESFSGETGSDGTITFSLDSQLEGTYTSTVIDVVKEGISYDPTSNVETSESLTVP